MSETAEKRSTAAAWKKAKRHTITLPSGTVIDIELPNIQFLLKTGQVPNTLVQLVTTGSADPNFKITPELLAEQFDFTAFIVAQTVVEPKIEVEDVKDLPAEDLEMIVDFAMRNRDLDAVGHHLAGLETQSSFRTFRGLDAGYASPSGV